MYKIPAKTLFVGKNLVFVPECHSTNTLALQLLANTTEPVDGTTIITDRQTAGRGQRGNSWQSGQRENITLSVILKPTFLPPKDQFFLTVVVALAVKSFVEKLTDATAWIKWPNDIIVHDKKVCGILIENTIQGNRISNSVIGIGLNVNQRSFDLPHATSLAQIVGNTFELEDAVHDLLHALESEYLNLKAGRLNTLKTQYLDALYRRNQLSRFLSSGKELEGVISGVDDFGRLKVIADAQEMTFDLKQISMILHTQEQQS